MVVDQRMEAVLAAIPDVPDEGAVVEQPAVLLEEAVAQPVLQRAVGVAGMGQQTLLRGRRPTRVDRHGRGRHIVADAVALEVGQGRRVLVSKGQQRTQTLSRRLLAGHS